jgi:hypothetical protein
VKADRDKLEAALASANAALDAVTAQLAASKAACATANAERDAAFVAALDRAAAASAAVVGAVGAAAAEGASMLGTMRRAQASADAALRAEQQRHDALVVALHASAAAQHCHHCAAVEDLQRQLASLQRLVVALQAAAPRVETVALASGYAPARDFDMCDGGLTGTLPPDDGSLLPWNDATPSWAGTSVSYHRHATPSSGDARGSAVAAVRYYQHNPYAPAVAPNAAAGAAVPWPGGNEPPGAAYAADDAARESGYGGGGAAGPTEKRKCYNCKVRGHLQGSCPHLPQEPAARDW